MGSRANITKSKKDHKVEYIAESNKRNEAVESHERDCCKRFLLIKNKCLPKPDLKWKVSDQQVLNQSLLIFNINKVNDKHS